MGITINYNSKVVVAVVAYQKLKCNVPYLHFIFQWPAYSFRQVLIPICGGWGGGGGDDMRVHAKMSAKTFF